MQIYGVNQMDRIPVNNNKKKIIHIQTERDLDF